MTQDELKALYETQEKVWKELEKCKDENAKLKAEISAWRQSWKNTIPTLQEEIDALKKEKEKLEAELAEKQKLTEESCMTIAQHEKLMEECRNYYEKQLAEKDKQIIKALADNFSCKDCPNKESIPKARVQEWKMKTQRRGTTLTIEN